jgi:heme/copper-type cytochrome/quinol oxidase subunit 2
MITLLSSIVCFCIGCLFGWAFRGLASEYNIELHYNINNVIASVVLIAWFVSVMASVCVPDFEVDPLLHGIMGAIVTFFFTKKNAKN